MVPHVRVIRAGKKRLGPSLPIPVQQYTIVQVEDDLAGVVVENTPAGVAAPVYVGGLFGVAKVAGVKFEAKSPIRWNATRGEAVGIEAEAGEDLVFAVGHSAGIGRPSDGELTLVLNGDDAKPAPKETSEEK